MPLLTAVARRAVPALALGLAAGLLTPAATGVAHGQNCLCGTLADEFRAADAGLVREWIVQVPFDSGGWRLEHVVVGDGLVLAQSGDGALHAIRASGTTGPRAGTVAWSRTIGAAAGQSWPPTVGARLVLVSSELAVHAIDRDTGVVEWERSTASLTAGAAVQSGDWVYQPLRTNRMLRLPVNPLESRTAEEPAGPEPAAGSRPQAAGSPRAPESLEPLSIDAGGSLQAAALPVGKHDLIWFTTNGFVALKRTDLGWIRRQLPESDPPTWVRQASLSLAGPAVVRGGTVFTASRDGSVTAILLQSQKVTDDRGVPAGENGEDLAMRVAWNFTFPEAIASGPLVSGDVVLVSLGPAGVAALSTVDGRQLWKSDLVGTIVAAAGGRVWLLDAVGRLTALDLATGSRRQSCCVGCFTVPVVNTFSERLILASPGGLLVSLAPPRDPEAARPVTADAPEPEAPAPADPDATPP